MPMKITIIAEGWIQSVEYRAFVKRVANQLGLRGLVRNLPDGRIEVFCEGALSKINKLLKMMNYRGRKGDALSAYVESLSVYREGEKGYRGPWKEYGAFDVDYGFEIQSPVDRALIENLESGTLYVTSSRDEFGLLKDEFSMFRKETNKNFETMEEKYGSISEEIKKMRATFEKLVDAYIKRQK
ncbi:MAG: acylphosphatase [Crenarchaeota archaeon]|nr:acylphosphatase [Thermoproteota archaeon]